jgi:nucleotide-binding universal stress UspA family protein
MRTILFPTDFSPAADHAFTFALHLAAKLKAEICFLHAYNMAATADMLAPGDFLESLRREEEENARRHLDQYQRRIQQEAGQQIPVRSVVRAGFPTEVIQEVCDSEAIDLIVMGTRGASSRFDAWLGSITTQVMEQVRLPVLAVPEKAHYQGLRSIAYASDLLEKDLTVAQRLGELSRALGADLHCVHVRKPSEAALSESEFQHFRDMYRQDTGHAGLELYVLADNEVAERLDTFMEAHHVHLLALANRRLGFWERLFSPSLSRRLALHSDKPLLIFQAD